MIYGYMINVYSILIKAGKYALTADDNPKNLAVIPEPYIEKVAEKLAEEESAKMQQTPEPAKPTADDKANTGNSKNSSATYISTPVEKPETTAK